MFPAISVAAGAVILSCALALFGLSKFRHVQRLPTNFGAGGGPTATAPNWIALGFIPLVLLFCMVVVIVTKQRAADSGGALQGVSLVAVFGLFAQISHLILLRKHVGPGPNR